MTPRGGILLLTLLLATACGGPAPLPAPPPARAIPLLSATDRAGNAERIAAFFRQQCVERLGSRAAFEEGLRASGWSARETQDSRNSPDHGTSGGYRFSRELPDSGAATAGEASDAVGFIHAVWLRDDGHANCILTVEIPIAAPFEPLRDALSRFAGRPTAGSPAGTAEWKWNDASGHGLSMQLIAGEALARRQINLSLSFWPHAWSEEDMARAGNDGSTTPSNSEIAR
jgi:hypothetical protein